jgi:hypothetical protein
LLAEGGTGVDWVHAFDSGGPGPNVMAQALTHGNEICGAIALDWLLRQRFRPQRGSLTLAFANVEAYARFDPPIRFLRAWSKRTTTASGPTSACSGRRHGRAAPRARASPLRRRR